MARPGRSPASAGGSVPAAARRPDRSPPAADCHHGGAVTSRGAPRTRSTATVRSARSGGASRPSAVTICPGSSPRQPSAGASSSTRPPTVQLPAPAVAVDQLGGHDHPRRGRTTRRRPTCAVRGDRRARRPAASPRRPGAPCSCRGCAVTSRVWAAMTSPAAAAVPAAASSAPATGARGGRRRPPRPRPTATTPPATGPSPIPAASPPRRRPRRGRAGDPAVGVERSPVGDGVRIRPSPARGAAGTGARRSRRSPAAAPPARSDRCGCANPRCAARSPGRRRGACRAARPSRC